MEKKLLYDRCSPCLQPLLALIVRQKRFVLAKWAIDCAPPILALFEQRAADPRPRQALEAANRWARGEIKMPEAKAAAHATHNAATAVEHDAVACAAARAMGHVIGTVHTEGHAIGVAMYGLTALVRASADPEQAEATWSAFFCGRLQTLQDCEQDLAGPWAPFLLREGPSKELPRWQEALRRKAERDSRVRKP